MVTAANQRDVTCEVKALTECAWAEEQAALQRVHGGASWSGTENVVILCDGRLIPTVAAFLAWLKQEYGIVDKRCVRLPFASPQKTHRQRPP